MLIDVILYQKKSQKCHFPPLTLTPPLRLANIVKVSGENRQKLIKGDDDEHDNAAQSGGDSGVNG